MSAPYGQPGSDQYPQWPDPATYPPAQPGYPPPAYAPPGQPAPGYAPPGPAAPGYPPQGFPSAPGYPAPAAPRPRGAGTGLVIGLVAIVVVLVGAAVTAAVVLPRVLAGKPAADPAEEVDLSAVIDYHQTNPGALTASHKEGAISYPMDPPAGGPHHPSWVTCTGKVYRDPVLKEKAVHSLEHGAVWITYKPGLDKAAVDKLAARVRGTDYTMLSPYPGQQVAISLQAWGYQLAVDSADDKRIDGFIRKYRVTASAEPGAPCSGGDG